MHTLLKIDELLITAWSQAIAYNSTIGAQAIDDAREIIRAMHTIYVVQEHADTVIGEQNTIIGGFFTLKEAQERIEALTKRPGNGYCTYTIEYIPL